MFTAYVYCVGGFLACVGAYQTESNPGVYSYNKTEQECLDNGALSARRLKAEHPTKDIRWKCVDNSAIEVKRDK